MICLLRNLYAGQEATDRTGHGTTDWFQIGKGIHQGYILSPCLFNLYTEYIMRNAGLEDAQLESRLPGEISVTSDMQMTLPLCMLPEKSGGKLRIAPERRKPLGQSRNDTQLWMTLAVKVNAIKNDFA